MSEELVDDEDELELTKLEGEPELEEDDPEMEEPE